MLFSINPYSHTTIALYEEDSFSSIKDKVSAAYNFEFERKEITPLFSKLALILRNDIESLARIITDEMGKPIIQSRSEIEKCAVLCDYYAAHSSQFLEDEVIESDATMSFVRKAPYGVWLAIMPWNFPFWQVFRCAIPAIAAGNRVILKHASNVTGCAVAIEELFAKAGFQTPVFQVIKMRSSLLSAVISNPMIAGLSLTGSEAAGRSATSIAAANLKPQILELGGSNAFIVMEDADIEHAASQAVIGRFQNSGQSCIAAKRILVHESGYAQFLSIFKEKVQKLVSGNPISEYVYIGPLAKEEMATEIHRQVNDSVKMGAVVECGGKMKEAFYEPTILTNVTIDMPCMQEEVFGPVVPVVSYSTLDEAVTISNSTRFGLGVSLFTQNIESAKGLVDRFNEGAVFINSFVKSDPRLPFGGVKNSGYGRELSKEGLLAFTQSKTVWL
jgi:succinate-semialdehyde dehydrogenase / glutarate-semialdehyde dehydrogenase